MLHMIDHPRPRPVNGLINDGDSLRTKTLCEARRAARAECWARQIETALCGLHSDDLDTQKRGQRARLLLYEIAEYLDGKFCIDIDY